MIFNQGTHPECKGYSFLGALKILKPEIDHDTIINAINEDEKGLLTNQKACAFFKSRGFIKDGKPVPRIKIKGLLTRGIPLIAGVHGVDWDTTGKPPFIAKWKKDNTGITSHSIILRHFNTRTRLIECQNSWGEGWGNKGIFYIHADNFHRLSYIYQIIP